MIPVVHPSPRAPILLSDDGDAELESQLSCALQRHGMRVWSRADLKPSASTLDAILGERLDATQMLVVLVTGRTRPPRALGRPDDVGIALERVRRRANVPIVPVPLGGASLDRHLGLSRYVSVPVPCLAENEYDLAAAVAPLVEAFRAHAEAACEVNGVRVAEAILRRAGWQDAPPDVTRAHEEHIEELKRETRVGSPQRPRAGFLLAGQWVLRRRLGRGGFAEVWQAWDSRRKRDVAIKIMHPHIAHSPEHRRRIIRGIRHMQALGREHTVNVLDGPADHEGWFFFVMDHLVGHDLEYRIRKNKISRRIALNALVKIARSLDVAHGKDIVHRDVKPANILFTIHNRPVLTDFDLVLVDGSSGGTRTGPLGSYLFSAPEALLDARGATARSDVYSLGMCAAFVILEPEALPLMMRDPKRALDEAVASGSIHERLRDVILKAIAWDPSVRIQSAGDFARKLEAESRRHQIGRRVAGELCDRRTPNRPDLLYIPRSSDGTPDRTFIMGADGHHNLRPPPDERPHEVILSRAFLMARTPITESQYRTVLDTTGYKHRSFELDDIPATRVSWYEAVKYCNVLSALEDLMPAYDVSGAVPRLSKGSPGYRLPTEAEWEYACRAGGQFTIDKGTPARWAWYAANSDRRPCSVHRLEPNPWGLRHMLGNVWEWCHDPYGADITTERVEDPCGPSYGNDRVIRGGSCNDRAPRVRPSFRNSLKPNHKDSRTLVGFRIVRTILEDD